MLLTILTFMAAALLIVGLYSIAFDLVLKDRARVSQRLDEEFRQAQRQRIQRSPIFKDLTRPVVEGSVDTNDTATWKERLQTLLEQAGSDLAPQRLLLLMGLVGLGAGALTGFLSRAPLPGLVAGLIGMFLPLMYVQFKRKRRLDKLLSQLPDAFELIGRLIRAGQTINQAFQGVADEFQPPIATEFAYCSEQQNLGLSPESPSATWAGALAWWK
jgi:tight adherence protein B